MEDSDVGGLAKNVELMKMMLGFKDKAVPDLLDSVEQTKESIIKDFKESTPAKATLNDAYGNKITGTGTDDKIQSFSTYGFESISWNWPLWMALYNDSWVFRRAIDKPAQDMVRSGINLSLDSQKIDEVLSHKADQKERYNQHTQGYRQTRYGCGRPTLQMLPKRSVLVFNRLHFLYDTADNVPFFFRVGGNIQSAQNRFVRSNFCRLIGKFF